MQSGTLAVDRSLSTSEVADVLESHPHTVLSRLKSGEIPGAYRNGSHYKVRSERVREYIEREGFPPEILERLERLLSGQSL